uniref:Nuclear receptor domain-containing protein n=1 Tax=Panagrolaimus superbus TaxID=310955 RepID=A0A914YFM7_9BILA
MSPINSIHSSNSGPNSASFIDSKEGILTNFGNPLSEPHRPQSDLNVYSKCTVCEDVADGYHFSALSCAACSAFFRRSIADQKTYACVTRNCNVSINSRKHGVICRYCRFQKCIFAGMCPDEVQGKRNKILPESPGRSSPASSVSTAPYPTITTLRRGGGKGSRTSQARGPHVPLLNEMSGARRTLGNHRMMNINCPPSTNSSTPSTTTISNPFTMLEKEFVLFKKFCEQVAMLNGIITDNDHWQFSTELQNLFLTWVIFESVHATIRFGGIQTNRAYSGDLSNIDIDESSLTAYLSDGNMRDAASMARFAYPVLQFFNMHLCRNVQNMRLDEKEAAALMSLLLINQALSY